MTDAQWQNRIVGEGMEAPDQILANPYNWRKHPKHQKDALRAHLRRVGWVQRSIINTTTGHLVDGHLRTELAMEDGVEAIPVLYVELTEEEEKIALASLDSITILAETDQEMINTIVSQVDAGDAELAAFLQSLTNIADPETEEDGKTGDDDSPEPEVQVRSQPGDIWILGDHRVMCGDGTSIEAAERLCDDGPIDMIWTDPPYNVDYEGGTGLKIENDNMDDARFRAFLRDLFTAACRVTREGGPIYVAHADSEGINFRAALQEGGFLLKQNLVWVKNSMVLGRQDYQWQHEPILYGWKPGAAHKWYGEFNKKTVIDDNTDLRALDKSELLNECRRLRNALNTSIIREDKPARNGEHPTMKPVSLIIHMLKNSSQRGDRILDLCGGSGSTLIAAQKIGRAARLMELDPRYCDVIVKRWQQFTGQEAVHADTGEAFYSRKPVVDA